MRRFAIVGLLLFLNEPAAWSQRNSADDSEDWRVEMKAGYWPLMPSGGVLTRSTTVDLKRDLGVSLTVQSSFRARRSLCRRRSKRP
jgi:hypothetical protein